MKRLCQKAVALVIIVALGSGCATTTGTTLGSSPAAASSETETTPSTQGSVSTETESSPASPETASNDPGTAASSSPSPPGDDSTKTKLQGAGVGAVVLGVIGGVVGALVARDAGAVAGAGIGMALGGLLGYAAGSAVAARKKNYAREEDRLNDLIKIAGKDNQELINLNAQTSARIKTLECEISELKQCYAQDTSKIGDMEEKQKEINSLISKTEKQKLNMNNEFVALNEYLQSVKQTQQQDKVAQLEQEVTELKKNIEMLDNNNKQMAQMAESLTVRK